MKIIHRSIDVIKMFCFLILISVSLPSTGQDVNFQTPFQSRCHETSNKIWDSIVNYYYGVAGTGFIGKDETITRCEAEASDGGPWRPIDGKKHTLCGYLSLKHNEVRENEDGDIDLYVIPDPAFRWLQFNSLRPRGHYYDAYSLCCEVAMKEPGNTITTDGVKFLQSIPLAELQYKPIGVYGAWVSDMGHDKSPEIHPVQQIWRNVKQLNGNTEYHLYSMWDNSKRFNDPTDFPSGCLQKAWMPIPLINIFYIPFEFNINSNSVIEYNVTMPSSNNINSYNILDNQMRLIINGRSRVIVNRSNRQFPMVVFYEICQKDDNTIRGYLFVETSIGKTNTTAGAHAFVKVVKSVRN